MGWLASWSAEVLNRFKVQSTGRTSFEMATLHKCRHKVLAFGEKVYFQHTLVGKEDDRKDVGVFVGMVLGTYGTCSLNLGACLACDSYLGRFCSILLYLF